MKQIWMEEEESIGGKMEVNRGCRYCRSCLLETWICTGRNMGYCKHGKIEKNQVVHRQKRRSSQAVDFFFWQ